MPSLTQADRGRETLDIAVEVFGQTDVGRLRDHNEDHLLVACLATGHRAPLDVTSHLRLDGGPVLLAVCDGMGGAAAGEVASHMAADLLYESMAARVPFDDDDALAVGLVEALATTGSRIHAEASASGSRRGMGTTATVAALRGRRLLIGQVGDSRAYVFREGRLVQVTRDQSLVNHLLETGQLTETEAATFEHSNIILQALGTGDDVQVDLTSVELCRGDVLLLCSDGLNGMLSDEVMLRTFTGHPDVASACEALIDEANEAGGDDNITAIVARFTGEGLPEPAEPDVEALAYAKYALSRAVAYDDTPVIEIHGEVDVSWDELLDEHRAEPWWQQAMLGILLIVAMAIVLGYLV